MTFKRQLFSQGNNSDLTLALAFWRSIAFYPHLSRGKFKIEFRASTLPTVYKKLLIMPLGHLVPEREMPSDDLIAIIMRQRAECIWRVSQA
jgi:hypothetical protein